ncbi:MAG TPA: 50S ribosomal protein L18, partial [Actinomycetota bacterium]|nr:50S ribosomal protein L18 [Actinomycetota bacterium]
MDAATKRRARIRRHARVRKHLSGTAGVPRLAVYRSNRHVYAQLIDDVASRTIASASDADVKSGGDKTAKAKAVGELLAQR